MDRPLAAVALVLVLPWAALSLVLPAPYALGAMALLGALALLLTLAGAWAWRKADERGLDPARWAFVTVLTCGAAMPLVLLSPPPRADADGIVCWECGRVQALDEPFCMSCGAT